MIGGILPMPIIRQGSLFDLQDLFDLEPTQRYEAVISAIDLDLIFQEVNKKSDKTPSESAYSRLLTKLSESDVLEKAQSSLLHQAISEGFITDDIIAIDATHFEACDKAPLKEEQQLCD